MKIAYFTDTFYPDLNGVTVSQDHFSKQLRKKGHTVIFFAPKSKGYMKKSKNVYRISSLKLIDSEPKVRFPLPISRKTLREIVKQDFDIVHAHGNGPFSLLGYQIALMKGIPYVMTFHTLHTKYAHYFLKGKVVTPRMIAAGMRVFASICDGIIVPSEKMLLELKENGVKKKINVIPNFVPKKTKIEKNIHFLHELLSLPTTTPIILSIGRLGIEKNFSFLISAFKKVSQENNSAHLVIIGKGPEKEKLEEMSRNFGIKERVHFIENIDQNKISKAYLSADMFVFPSQSETQGMCVLEAAVYGLPLVLSDDLAYANVIEDKKNGFILKLDENAFAKSILKLLSDKKLRQEMGKESQKIASKNFNPEKITDSLIELYQSNILKQQRSKRIIKKVNRVALARIIQIKRNIDKILN